MNVWIIQIGEQLPLDSKIRKMRTAILVDKLINRGHTILWWSSAFDHFMKNWIFKKDTLFEINNNFKIFALKGVGYKRNVSLSRFIDHRMIAHKFRKYSSNMPKPDIIVASVPSHDLAYEAVVFAKKNNIPVLIDIRDPWPDLFLEYLPKLLRKLGRLLLYFDFKMTKNALSFADGLIAVTNTFLEWGLEYAGRKKGPYDRIYYLGYKKPESIDLSKAEDKYSFLLQKLDNKFIVFFVGSIGKNYHDPSVLLDAAKRMDKIDKKIHFVIGGHGELFEKLRGASRKLSNVTLTGWLNQDEIEFWLKKAKIGVCPVTRNVNLPTNKAFTYLSAGLPIISSFQGDLKEIIEKYQIGYYYPPNDVTALVDCIVKLYNNDKLYKRMSENAQKVFYMFFDADKIYEEYAEHVERIANEFRKN